MRVVLDTNILVSAALKQKPLPGMTALVVERRGGLLKSLATEAQLFEVIVRPYFDVLIDPDTRAWLKKLMAAAELVPIAERIAACRDPTDDKFLELPVNGHADLIVTGDGDLLALNPFRQIPIVTPAAFVQGVVR
jgi:putative PIN family toxin of toxin-antitoxin system